LLSANIQVQVLIDMAVMDGVPYISPKARRVLLCRSNRGAEAIPCDFLKSWEETLANLLVVPEFPRGKMIKLRKFLSPFRRMSAYRERDFLHSENLFCKIFLWFFSLSLNETRV